MKFNNQRDLDELVTSPEKLVKVIEQVIERAMSSPIKDKVRVLDANRTAYFDPLYNTIVIVDKRLGVPGIIYKPSNGFEDFLNLIIDRRGG